MDFNDLKINLNENSLYNFILTLYFGFMFIYVTAPNPNILYKKIIKNPNK